MRPGPGWYLFRCPRCKQAFIATDMAEWCDCGNTQWVPTGPFVNRVDKRAIRVEMDLGKAEGCVVVWDHARVRDSYRVWDSKAM